MTIGEALDAFEDEWIESLAFTPHTSYRRTLRLFRMELGDRVEQPLEQLDDGGAGDRARAHQPAEEARQPADGHRRVVLECALQLAMRRLHDLATDVAVGRVEQAGERCVHRGFGV
jgi:hypothetical protein